jgi:2-polyprenyl-3-methyl-5-hydroxy-6-metoxy-1,4-benzoquinol methylase
VVKAKSARMSNHVCPVWVGYFLASPLRKLFHDPRKLLAPYLSDGMIVMDVGCAMGFFSLPMAELVGADGRVVSIDVQEKMLTALRRRATRAGLQERIETRTCKPDSLGVTDLRGRIDFALAFAVVHEVADARALVSEIHATLKSGGTMFVAEPRGHVKPPAFEQTLSTAEACGFQRVEPVRVRWTHAVVLRKL